MFRLRSHLAPDASYTLTTHADKPLPLNCPVCGVPLRFLKTDDSTGLSVELYHGPMHGVYYFDKKQRR